VLPNGSYYLLRTGKTNPTDMAAPSRDDRFHHCTCYPMANNNALFVVLASSLADQRTRRTEALIGWPVLRWRRAQPMR
jgi:hypothetical protein